MKESDWLESDDTFYYTGEYDRQGLQQLAREFEKAFPLKDRFISWIGSITRLWWRRVHRLAVNPRSLLLAMRYKFIDKKGRQ